jgi:ABC-2 type transport system ATP-binding protein
MATLRASPGPASATHGEVILRTRDLTKRYGDRLAVSNLNLDGRRGDVLGFLGPNGAGKTTTIRMLLGLIRPTAGSVEIIGMDVGRAGARALPHVGALVEQPALYTWLSGRENVRAVGDALGGVPEQRIDETLDLVGLRGRDRDRVNTYSLGMKQRLGLALALLSDPDLLVLDEPTNGLDPAGIVEMRDLLRQLAARGKLVFISSHALGEVQQMCTRVAVIAQGKLMTESSVEELTRAHGAFLVTLARAAEALALIRAQPWGAEARMEDDGRLITPAPEGESGALNLFLVQAGFTPQAIAPYTRDLEEVFLRMTGAASDGARKGGAQ